MEKNSQLVKKDRVYGYQNISPNTYIDAVTDRTYNYTLQDILQKMNMYYLPYRGNTDLTRLLVPRNLRHPGLVLTYKNFNNNIIIEYYTSDCIEDCDWICDCNWKYIIKLDDVNDDPIKLSYTNNQIQISYDGGKTWKVLVDLNEILSQYYTKEEIDNKNFLTEEQYKGTVTKVILNNVDELPNAEGAVNIGKVLCLGAEHAVVLEDGTDLDAIVTANTYYKKTVSANISNEPTGVNNDYYKLIVQSYGLGSNYRQQILYTAKNADIYVRVLTNSGKSWTPWRKLAAGDDVDLSNYYTKNEIDAKKFLTKETDPVFTKSAAHGITQADITNWNNKSTFDGDYNSLTNKPTIPSLSGYATQTWVNQQGFLKNYTEQYTGTVKSITTADGKQEPDASGDINLTTTLANVGKVKTVTINGTTKNPDADGDINLGDVGQGTVKSVKLNGTTKNPSGAGVVDLGTVITGIKVNNTLQTVSSGVVNINIADVSQINYQRLTKDEYTALETKNPTIMYATID